METDREFSSLVNLPQFPGPSIVTRTNAPADPNEATAVTIDRMKALALADANSPQVMRAANQALVFVPSDATQRQRSCALFYWISRNVKFREDDPVLRICLGLDNELELLIAPAQLLSMAQPAGDCDCLTTLCMSMHLAAGIPIEPITIKADHEDPSRDSHVYCQAITDEGPLVLDPAQGCKHHWHPGDEAPGWYSKDEWGAVHPPRLGLHGLDGLSDCGDGTDPVYDSWCAGGIPPGTISPGNPAGGIDWNSIIQKLEAGGLHIATMQGTPVGYVQTPNMVANYGPGGVIPSQIGGIGTGTLLLGGGLLLALLAFGKK